MALLDDEVWQGGAEKLESGGSHLLAPPCDHQPAAFGICLFLALTFAFTFNLAIISLSLTSITAEGHALLVESD